MLGPVVEWKVTPGKRELDINKKNVKILSFPEYADALEWIVDQAIEDGTAIINSDSMRMNAILRRHEKPQISAWLDGSNPGIPQIFKLGLSLLINPLNAHNLLAYLQLPKMPLPCGLANMLAKALLRDNGLGEQWNKTVAEYEKNLTSDEKTEVDKKMDTFLFSLLKACRNDDLVDVAKAKEYCADLVAWAKSAMSIPSADSPFLSILAEECNDMITLLNTEGATMKADAFERYIKQIYSPSSVKVDNVSLNSIPVVKSLGNLVDYPKKLIWLSCNGDLGTYWPYSFLAADETAELAHVSGVTIPSKSVYFCCDFYRMVDCLNGAEEIVLCQCSYDKGAALREHPAITLCKKANVSPTDIAAKTWAGPISHFKPRDMIDKEKDMLGSFSRTESATSVEELTGYPFDYYLDDVLGIKDASDTALKDLELTQGLVAHLVFKELAEECNNNVDEMETCLNRQANEDQEDPFVSRVKSAAAKVGAHLLLPSAAITLGAFCGTLKKSLNLLLSVLRSNGFFPLACEKDFEVDLGGELGKVRGSVDLVVTNADGQLAIIDFKYSIGKYYIEKLKNDTAVQLEIYKMAMEKEYPKPVIATGYWFFKVNELHSCDAVFSGPHVVIETKTANPTPLRERIENSMSFRRNEFRAGHFEILEDFGLAGTAYFDAIEAEHLLLLPTDEKRAPKKKFHISSTTKTTHEVLKDNIK